LVWLRGKLKGASGGTKKKKSPRKGGGQFDEAEFLRMIHKQKKVRFVRLGQGRGGMENRKKRPDTHCSFPKGGEKSWLTSVDVTRMKEVP